MKNKSIETKQKDFYFFLEKIVNVALAKTKKGDSQSVIDILDNLKDVFDKFWNLKQKNPQKFDELFWDYDFFRNYVQSPNNISLQTDTSYMLTFYPEKTLKGITVFIQSYEKIWQCAIKYNNNAVSRYSVYHLVAMLGKVACEESNNLIIEQFLRVINLISFQATSSREPNVDSSVYTASIYWYFDIVFKKTSPKSREFDLSYLEIFNQRFFESLKSIVSNNKVSLFNGFVSYLYDGILVSSHSGKEIWKYTNLGLKLRIQNFHECYHAHKLDMKAIELGYLFNNLDNKKDLQSYLRELNEVEIILDPIFSEEQKEIALETKNKIVEYAISQLKFNNILDITFDIGSYCLFKQKLEYISYLWKYKQPFDANASYCGHDILPNTIKELFNIYFRQRERDYRFEDHHGSSLYQTQYLLILLTYLHIHCKRDLEIQTSNLSIIILEAEYVFINKFLQFSSEFIEACEILIKESHKWDSLLSFEEEDMDEYQSEYNKGLIKVTAEKQFDNTKKWLKSKKAELSEAYKEIEKCLPVDSEKELQCKEILLDLYSKNNIISKVASLKKTYDESLDFNIINCSREKITKNCFIKVSNYNCDMLFSSFINTVVKQEITNFIKKILSYEDIEQIDVGSLENVINTYDAIESSINFLTDSGLTPSTILMSSAVLNEFLKEEINSKYKFYMKFTEMDLKLDEFTSLEIVEVPQEIENNIIIVLDKKSCIWTFKSIEDKNKKVYIEINENKTEKDITQVDLTVKTVANLEVANKNAIKVLKIY